MKKDIKHMVTPYLKFTDRIIQVKREDYLILIVLFLLELGTKNNVKKITRKN